MIFSDTAVAPLADNPQEPSRRLFREVHDAIEALGTPAAENLDCPTILLVHDQHVQSNLSQAGSRRPYTLRVYAITNFSRWGDTRISIPS
jgi:hypothetical protein